VTQFILFGGNGNIGTKVLEMLRKLAQHRSQFFDIMVVDQTLPADLTEDDYLPVWQSETNFIKSTYDEALVNEDLKKLAPGAIVINAMPHFTSKVIPSWCVENGAHYFDFTEDVSARQHVKDLQAQALEKKLTLAPGQGLAPGMINIIAAQIIQAAAYKRWKNLTAKLRVGALAKFVDNPYRYVFTWSPDGVVNEYLNTDKVVKDFEVVEKEGLDDLEQLTLDGHQYEAFITSGGTGSLIDDFDLLRTNGTLRNLNYKSLREPGHWYQMVQLLNYNRSELFDHLTASIPFVTENDYVVVYVSVSGEDKDGRQRQETYYNRFDGQAIQRTTAGGLLAVVELMMDGKLPAGFVRHSNISFNHFRETYSWSLMNNG
jgi:saccharopine dehydrogenase-like NADP-dependent oxidoreductase